MTIRARPGYDGWMPRFIDRKDHVRAACALLGYDRPQDAALHAVVHHYVRRVLEACDDNRSTAAALLGVDRKTIARLLARHGRRRARRR